ncbi:unnamed protein product [Pleuronectes platessa]|uniref:Uncharacterized protein n=1 Tax=Pleuronectes platessa TaxID=8262 RepID=A0A9N7Y2W4_PLEPL|nr:unnamed protein product [Pleuronectes platessa]
MVDLFTFKTQVKSIVNNLTQTLIAQIFTAAEKTTLNIQSPKAQEKLGALVDALCAEAVENILQIVVGADEQQEKTPGDRRGCSPSDVMKTQIHEGAGGEQTYILVYGSAAGLLVSLQGGAEAGGEFT